MAKDIKDLYVEQLIKQGKESKRLKLLPKNPLNLTVAEYYFLLDYIMKLKDSCK